MKKYTMRKGLALMVVLCLTFLAVACGGPAPAESTTPAPDAEPAAQDSAPEDAAPAADEPLFIAACMQGNQSGFILYVTSGIFEYQKAEAPDIQLEVVYADDDPAKQQSQVENFVSQGAQAIILNPVDKIQSAAAVDFAAENGVPVITVNTMSESANVAAHVGSDDVEAGIIQMQRLLDVGPESPKVAYIDAVLGHSAQVFRAQGYTEVLEANPDAELVVHDTANWSGEEALRLVENWLQTYPEIDMIAAHADCILVGAITAVENAGLAGEILLSGIDCDMPVMEKIKEGVVDSSLWQDGLGQGANALRLAIEAAQGNPVSDYLIPFEVCNGDNVDEYIAKANERNAIAAEYF